MGVGDENVAWAAAQLDTHGRLFMNVLTSRSAAEWERIMRKAADEHGLVIEVNHTHLVSTGGIVVHAEVLDYVDSLARGGAG